MEKCDFFIKKSDIELPSRELLLNYYNSLNYNLFTLIYSDGKTVFTDKNCEVFSVFLEHFYQDIQKEYCAIIVFHNSDGFYSDYSKEKLFYRTNNHIAISSNKSTCLDNICFIDKKKFEPLFSMFLKNNNYVEISPNGNLFSNGTFYYKDNCAMTSEIKEKENHAIVKVSKFPICLNGDINRMTNHLYSVIETNKIKDKKCYLCGSENENILVINRILSVCPFCAKMLNVQRCHVCGNYFSPKYFSNNNECIECYDNCKIADSIWGLQNSIGLKLLPKIDSILNKSEKSSNCLAGKTLVDIHTMIKQADKMLKKFDKKTFFIERKKLIEFLCKE